MIKSTFVFLFSLLFIQLLAQDSRLAEQYFQDGEYEKAGVLFSKLLEQNKTQSYFFNRTTECLIYQDKMTEAETLVKKQLKFYPDEAGNYVVYGNLLEKMGNMNLANEQFKKAIDKLPIDRNKINSLAGTFVNMTKYDLSEVHNNALLFHRQQWHT